MRYLFGTSLFFMTACSQIAPSPAPEPTRSDWGTLLVTSDSLVEIGEFARADSILLQFAREHEGSRPALEVPFWRALYMLDPRNTNARVSDGAEMMEQYADSPSTWWYKSQANVLRYLGRQVETLRGAATPSPIVVGDNSPAGLAARDQEIRNLRAELARVNAELERIKRRLAAQPSRP